MMYRLEVIYEGSDGLSEKYERVLLRWERKR